MQAQCYIEEHGLPKRKFETWKHTPIQTVITAGMLEHRATQEAPLPPRTLLAFKNKFIMTAARVEIPTPDPSITYHAVPKGSHEIGKIFQRYPIDYSIHPLAAWVHTQTERFDCIDVAAHVNTHLHILHCIPVSQDPASFHAWRLIRVGAGTTLTLIEETDSGSASVLFNHLTLIHLEQDAQLHYIRMVPTTQKNPGIHGLHVWQEDHTETHVHTLHLSTQKERSDIEVHLTGENARTTVNNTILSQKTSHQDQHVRIHHLAPYTISTTDMRAVSADQACSVTHSKVMIPPHSQHAEAQQHLHHLVLSPDAKAAIEPQLEIDTDQVKCTHGANVGQLDEAALHYCLSRGISKEMAERILTQAFLANRLNNIQEMIIRESLETSLAHALENYFHNAHQLQKGAL
jgi:Fe-S cluster assembly scaffold protein SufB